MDDAIQSLHFLADLHLHQHQFKILLVLLFRSVTIGKQSLWLLQQRDDQDIELCRSGAILQNEFALAMESHQEALRILKLCHGKDPQQPLVLDTLCQIGSVYYREQNSFLAVKNKKKDGYTTFIKGGMLEVIGWAHEDRRSYKMAISFFEEKLQFLESRGKSKEMLDEAAATCNGLGMLSS